MPTHVTHGQNVSTHPGQGQGQGHGTPPPFAQLPIVGVTTDSAVWTADTVCFTADGRIICIPASVAEPAGALDGFDAVAIAGGAVIAADLLEAATATDLASAVSIVSAAAIETASAFDGFDTVAVLATAMDEPATALDQIVAAVGAQVLFGTVAEAADARDQLDAAVVGEAVSVPGGGVGYYHPPRPLPVYGVGFGILPQLWGEAHGVVGVAGKSAAQVLVHADAVGACGQAGTATVVLKGLSVVGNGAVGTRGAGSGTIVKFSGSATGRHDDDEAAVIAFLLAA